MIIKTKFTNSVYLFIYFVIAILGHFLFSFDYGVIATIVAIEVARQVSKNNLITGYSFWLLGFLLLVCVDGVLTKEMAIEKIGYDLYHYTSSLFLISILIIIFTYHYFRKKDSKKHENVEFVSIINKTNKQYLNLVIIVIIYLIFIYSNLPPALNTLIKGTYQAVKDSEFGGLNGQNRSLISTVMYFISNISGYIIPALIYFWNFKKYANAKKAILYSILLSLPIWSIYFLIGVRQNILYSVIVLLGVFSLTKLAKLKFKFKYLIVLYIAFLGSNVIKEARQYGYIDYIFGSEQKVKKRRYLNKDKTEKTTLYMGYVVDYYEDNNYRYGKSTGAIMLFWVPRKLWNDKPPIFGYWFIREYFSHKKLLGFGDKYSAPSSYLATPYSDFGFMGVLFISWVIAFVLNKVDLYFRKNAHTLDYKKMIIISFCLAGFFFLPRQLNQFFSKTLIVYFFLQIIFIFKGRRR